MNRYLSIIHENPEHFLSLIGSKIYNDFCLVSLKNCDIRDNEQMCDSVGWAIRTETEIVIIGVPDDSDQSIKNIKASYEWLLKHEIPVIFVFPDTTTPERLQEIATTKDVRLLTTVEFGKSHLPSFIEEYIDIFHKTTVGILDDEYLI